MKRTKTHEPIGIPIAVDYDATPNANASDTNANVAISIGTIVPLVRIGAGSATIDAVAGVTLNGVDGGSKVISTRYQGALLRKTGTNAWILSGDIA